MTRPGFAGCGGAPTCEAKGQAGSLLLILEARGITLTDELRQTITTCADSHQLNQWLQRAATATTTEEVFPEQ